MTQLLHGWNLTEGRVPGEWKTASPTHAQVAAALEAILPQMEDPYVILAPPAVGEAYPNYCQALAFDGGYCCEVRIYGQTTDDYTHYRLLHPDEFSEVSSGGSGYPEDERGYHPDLRTILAVFSRFMENPNALPGIGRWRWVDVTEEVDGQI